MADTKISGLTALTGANTASGDLLTIVDVSDTTMAATGTNKKITLTELQSAPVSGGTANGVLYLNGSKVATSGSALVFDGTNLGVGTNLPLGKLDARGDLYVGANARILITEGGTGDAVIGGRAGTAFLALTVNGSEQARLTSTGLGIGTSSPGYKLDVNGAANFANGVYHRIGGTPFIATSANYTYFYANTNGIIWRNSADTVNQIVLSPDGNLGLGVTPSAWDTSAVRALQIGAQAAFAAESTVAHVITNAYYNAGWKYIGTGNATDYYQLNGAHVWRTSASGTAGNAITFTQAMTLDSSGNLLVGTTSGTFAKGIFVTDSDSQRGLHAGHNSSASTTDGLFYSYTNTTSSTAFNHIGCQSGGSGVVFKVLGNGNAQNTNNSYGAISDVKLKENIVDASPKLADLMQVRIRNYNLKTDPEHKQIGVIAQELEQVFPAMIEESPDRDSEGNNLGTTTKSVKYSVFVPMLIKAMQEQQAQIESLRKRLADAGIA